MSKARKGIEATLDLLWSGLGQPKRGPRHNLTVHRLVDTAMAVAAEEGVGALSMRKVAARLGVGAASLYTYVPDKAALLALMTDTMTGQATLPHTRPGDWREKVEAWAREDIRVLREHPWAAEITSGQYVGPNAFAWTDSAIRAFDGTGLSAHEALTVVEAVNGLIRGHLTRVVAADRAERWTDADGRSWSTVQEAYLVSQRIDADRYPAVQRLETSGPTPMEAFEQGLAWLLDGVERRIEEIRAAEYGGGAHAGGEAGGAHA
ncbi:TetR/AcrR family transcriptional regulator [Nocardiopsis nanhaiensis]